MIEWSIKLEDMVSSPGARIERQLYSVTRALKLLDMQARQTRLGAITDPLKRSRLELQIQRDKLLLSKKAMETSGSALGGFSEKLRTGREAMRDWLQILDPIARGFGFVASNAARMGRDIARAVGGRESALLGLNNALGDAGGRGMMQQIQAMSIRSGRPVDELSQRATQWANLGMDPKLIMPSLTARSDAQALGLDTGKFDSFIEQTLSKPMMDMREAKAGTVGLVKGKGFYENLGKIVGRKPGDLEQDLSTNRVSGQAGLIAMLQTLQQQQGGTLGGGTDKFSHTLEGILDRFQTRLTKLWAGLSDTPGFKTFKSAMENLLTVLNQSKTQKLVNDIANSLGKMLEPLTGPDGKKKMEDFFTSMTSKIEGMIPGLTNVVGFFGKLAGWGLLSIKGLGMLGDLASDTAGIVTGSLKRGQESDVTRGLFGAILDTPPVPGWTATPNAPASAAGKPAARQHNLTVNVKVDARGATKEDAHEIAKQISDQVPTHIADALEQMNTEAP